MCSWCSVWTTIFSHVATIGRVWINNVEFLLYGSSYCYCPHQHLLEHRQRQECADYQGPWGVNTHQPEGISKLNNMQTTRGNDTSNFLSELFGRHSEDQPGGAWSSQEGSRKFIVCCRLLSQTMLLSALFHHLIIPSTAMITFYCQEPRKNIFSTTVPSQDVAQGNMRKTFVPHSWQVCVGVQTLSLEIDGSARDRLAFDQSGATDISTYAEWIIKNTSDPLWRNKLLLLLHTHMQYVSSGGKVEVIF